MSYLLDTNVCIELINGTSLKVRSHFLRALRHGLSVATSTIVTHELWSGVAKSQLRARNAEALSVFLGRDVAVLDYTEKDAQAAGEIRVRFEQLGTRIGEYDTLIAGHAFSRNLVLVTANVREFKRIKGLAVEDWMA